MPSALPLVTCLMPTCDRRGFVPHAVACFLQQDYPCLELLVADDGDEPVGELLPQDPRIRYVRMDGRRRIGGKRNVACAAARGELIVHWDDDDWSAPWRVSYQVRALLDSGADVCGLARVLFFEPAAARGWEYVYPASGRPWVHGATLAYRASYWRRNLFPDIHVGEDTRFVWSDAAGVVQPLDRTGFYVGTIHARNTSPKQTGHDRWRAVGPEAVAGVIGNGWPAYCRAAGGQA